MADGGASTLAVLGAAQLGVLGYAASLGVGLVFMQAAVPKLRNTQLFAGVLANYRLLPGFLIAPAALLLPIAELWVGLALMLDHASHFAPVAMALLLLFAIAMGINIARGRREIDCGCGRSDLRQPLSWLLVVRNVLLAALLLPYLGTVPDIGLNLVDSAIAMAGGITIYLLYLLFNAIGALAASPLAAQRR
ncbi:MULTISPECIES: MauE/DoxX family redox-associated membrane protein [unclassified Novosphingobium]|uniref:MauE/DoxX family redox-associated membrane protein n=1 Tax=unclassified Novosphingobium TaxID=2644732 RepID=UPI0006B9656D|nr:MULTISPECIES: MauE/DoxX family redox-associated membrane protein [unclassified Novosphingobium]KPF89670.1 hypothetical protein IP83_01755 [Novosphingobium sp. AAP93]